MTNNYWTAIGTPTLPGTGDPSMDLVKVDDARAIRAAMRAYLKETDPRPEHWLKSANRTLQAKIDAVREQHGIPLTPAPIPEPKPVQLPIAKPPAPPQDEPAHLYVQQYTPRTELGGVPLE